MIGLGGKRREAGVSAGRGFWRDILDVLLYGGLGIVLLTAVALVSCRFCL